MRDFVHLHVHSVYSLLDGEARIGALVEKAKAMRQEAVAITDHGVMYGAVEFYKAAKAAGIKPILGCEVYVAARSRHDRVYEYDAKRYHLVLLAKNDVGYKNLMKIVSIGHIEGFYTKPRVDHEVLREYSEGLIALSGCVVGEIPQAILGGDIEKARALITEYIDIFGKENFYLEVQNHGMMEEARVSQRLFMLAQEFGIKLCATNDVHYIEREDSEYQDILMCIQTGKVLEDEERLKFEGSEYYLKSGDEMEELFGKMPEALESTVEIANRCNVELEFGKYHLPEASVEEGKTAAEQLRKLCYEGAAHRYGAAEKVQERLDYELEVIEKMGFVDYFLIVWDFIKFSKDNGIMVGPGRGSAAGSMVAYCLNITDIDPIRFNLIFERFLNPERISMPDIDIDFCYRRRQEVIDYVVEKYGKDRVAQIITFGTLAARASIRDVGRVMNMPYADVDAVAVEIPFAIGMTIERALEMNPKLRDIYEKNEKTKKLLDVAMALQGVPRHASTHAAGVVITKEPVVEYVPLQLSDESVITQFPMGTLEELGLLKMDFLGLRNLTIIRDTLDMVGIKDLSDIPDDDPEVFAMISAGHTDGVFQLESAGMKSFMRELKPRTMEDIVAGISLYRPGPMDSIPRYIENKNNPDKVSYKDPRLEQILGVTYGCVVYQEQVMQIVRELGGYSLGRADLLRRAMSKKKSDVMKQERENFIHGVVGEDGTIEVEGAVRRGVPEKAAAAIFDEMMDFCKYAFNKSHAAAYARIAYETAYLKKHHTVEFMAALMTAGQDFASRTAKYVAEARRMGIKLRGPDVNESGIGFTAVKGEGETIRFGLEGIKGVGHGITVEILKERERGGKFTGLREFCERMSAKGINKTALEALIKSGAFDAMGKRAQLLDVYEKMLEEVAGGRRGLFSGQMSFFESDKSFKGDQLPQIPEFPAEVLLTMERECLGICVSGHPLDDYREVVERSGGVAVADIIASFEEGEDGEGAIKNGEKLTVAGIITYRKRKFTKNNAEMAFIKLEDLTGEIECIVFPKILAECEEATEINKVVKIIGRISSKEEEEPKIICDKIVKLEKGGSGKVYVKVPSGEEGKFPRLKEILAVFPGDLPVYIYYEGSKKTVAAPREMWVCYNDILEGEVSNLLGAGAIKVVNK